MAEVIGGWQLIDYKPVPIFFKKLTLLFCIFYFQILLKTFQSLSISSRNLSNFN